MRNDVFEKFPPWNNIIQWRAKKKTPPNLWMFLLVIAVTVVFRTLRDGSTLTANAMMTEIQNNSTMDSSSTVSLSLLFEPTERVVAVQSPPPKQEKKTTLWLVTCETREGSQDIATWTLFAEAVKRRNHQKRRQQQQQQQQQKEQQQHEGVDPKHFPTVEIRNICRGKQWGGVITKMKYMAEFLDGLVSKNTTAMAMGMMTTEKLEDDEATQGINKITNDHDHTDIVIFMDSDVVFNVWGVSIPEVLERYDVARQNKPILISAEPNCFHGQTCEPRVVATLSPEAASDRSNCPRFVNSGSYMGDAKSLRDMIRQLTNVDRTPIKTLMRVLKMNSKDDQGVLMTWFDMYGRGKLATLDTHAMIFRNMFFGKIDASVPGRRCCGALDANGTKCGVFEPQYTGQLDEKNYAMVYDEVPGCGPTMTFSQAKEKNYITASQQHHDGGSRSSSTSTPMYYENIPFIIHGNGSTKKSNDHMITPMRARIEKELLARNEVSEKDGR